MLSGDNKQKVEPATTQNGNDSGLVFALTTEASIAIIKFIILSNWSPEQMVYNRQRCDPFWNLKILIY